MCGRRKICADGFDTLQYYTGSNASLLPWKICVCNCPRAKNPDLKPNESRKWFIHSIIDHYNPSVRIIDLVSHTTCVVYVNYVHKWWELQFNVNSAWQIFEKLFHDSFYLLSEFLLEICWEEIAEEILFVFFFFWCLAWDSNPGFTYNKRTHYLLDYGDFEHLKYYTQLKEYWLNKNVCLNIV